MIYVNVCIQVTLWEALNKSRPVPRGFVDLQSEEERLIQQSVCYQYICNELFLVYIELDQYLFII